VNTGTRRCRVAGGMARTREPHTLGDPPSSDGPYKRRASLHIRVGFYCLWIEHLCTSAARYHRRMTSRFTPTLRARIAAVEADRVRLRLTKKELATRARLDETTVVRVLDVQTCPLASTLDALELVIEHEKTLLRAWLCPAPEPNRQPSPWMRRT
jgi:hypothetical protein